MKKVFLLVLTAVFSLGVAQTGFAQCSGSSCKPLTKKQRKQVQSVQNDVKRQAWMKERQQHWQKVSKQQMANQLKYKQQLLQQQRLAAARR